MIEMFDRKRKKQVILSQSKIVGHTLIKISF